MAKTHYDYLGVKPTATLEEIKRGYRKTQLRCHPDKTRALPPQERAKLESLSKSANNAYELLTDCTRRAQYDIDCGFTVPTQSYSSYPKTSRPRARPQTKAAPQQRYDASSRQQEWVPRAGYIQPNTKPFQNFAFGWDFEATISSRFNCDDWCETATFFSEHQVTILIKVSLGTQSSLAKEQDIRVSFQTTPGQRRPSSFKSIYMQRVEEGTVERSIVITVKLDQNPNKRMIPGYEFKWDLEASHKMPLNPQTTMASCVEFHRDTPKDLYGPERMLKNNCHMEPCRLLDLGSQRCGRMRFGPDFTMVRVAAVGVQHKEA
ncbi:hypothetical protein BDV96DRAFT_692861 [Lophiotrema nucula]|uniref:J domain-containing protein n=1 Tax=Lophiotrema nucula TaxID=690887 RepID=A0A6A5YMH6_9PLEO|nr:hypothetical protein BDV96DRAFT_692861 [Lophiotrema nucula]